MDLPVATTGWRRDRTRSVATAKYIKELQAHLKTLPGGDALAQKVAGWGVFKNSAGVLCFVDPHTDNGKGNCYRGKPAAVKALTAEASA